MTRRLLVVLLLTGCNPRSVPACLDRCARDGIEQPLAHTLCTTSCRKLSDTYGISEEQCKSYQTGEPMRRPGDPPADLEELNDRCTAFVIFDSRCDPGDLDRDNVMNQLTRTDQCVLGNPPYDERRRRCYEHNGDDGTCESYHACAGPTTPAPAR